MGQRKIQLQSPTNLQPTGHPVSSQALHLAARPGDCLNAKIAQIIYYDYVVVVIIPCHSRVMAFSNKNNAYCFLSWETIVFDYSQWEVVT